MADINITVDTTSIGRARNELDSLGLTVLKQSQTVKRLERYYKQLDQAFNSGKLSAQQYAKGVKQLDAAIEEVSKSSLRTTNATKTLSNAQSSAAIAAQNLANAQRMSGKETNKFGMYAQQVGYQVGDFFIQMQSGTNILVAFGQQATQLAGLFPGVLGAALGIGISLGTAVGAAFMRMGEDANSAAKGILTLADAQKQLNEASGDYALKLEMLRFGVDTQAEAVALKEIYNITAQIQNLTKQYEQTDSLGARQRLAEEIQALKEQLSIQQDIVDEANKKRVAYETALDIDKQMAAVQLGQAKAIGQVEKDRIAAGEAIYKGLLAVQSANQDIARSNNEVSQTIKNNYQVYAKTRLEAQALAEAVAKIDLAFAEKNAQGLNTAMEDALAAGVQFSLVDLNSIVAAAASNGWALAASIQAAWRAATQKAPAEASVLMGGGGRPEIDLKNMEYRGAVMAAQAKILQKSFKDAETSARGAGKAIVEELTDAEQAAKDLADTLDGYVINAVESLGSAWGNFVVSGFTDFKSFASNVLDSFKNMLANMIALAAKNQIMLNLGIAGGGVGGVVGGLTGPGGPFGGVGALAGKIGGFGGNLITGAMGFVKSIGAGAKAVGSYLSTAVTGVKSLATLGTALGAVALPIAAVVAAVSFFKKKVKVLDTGLNVAVEGVNAFVTSFETKETKRFFGLSKKVKTSEGGVGADVSDPIQNAVSQMQQAVVDAAAAFGYGAESFKNFTYEFRLSLKGLTEEQQMQKINEELTKMGDAFASMIPDVSSLNELLEAAQQRYDLTTRLLQLQGKEEELIARQREAELAAVHPLNRELLVRIHSLEQEKMAAEKAIAAAQQARAAAEQAADAATSAVQTAFSALTASIRASVDTIVSNLRNKLTLANEAVTRSRDIFSQLQSALSSRSLSGGVETSKFRQSSALSFLSKGNFQDEEALKGALDVVSQPTEELYGSFEEYARNFFKTSAVIEKAKSVAERQLSQDEKQVALLEDQIDAAEAQYQIMVDQYGALLGINNSVLSVSQAIANLAKALAAQTAAQQAVDSATASEAAAVSASDKATQSINKNIEAANIIDQLYASGGYGKSNQEVYASWVKYAETQGTQKAIQEWSRLGNIGTVKGYANGGMHSGGVRLVGEDGPELEFTGPSRISSNKQSASMFRDPELRDAIMSLKSEVSGLRSDQLQIQMDISKYTKRSYDIERKWDVEGLPATRI